MSARRWSNVSYLDAIRPDPGWRTEHAFLASYSADLVALVAALLALAGLDDDRGSGSKVDFANSVDQLADKVRLIAQAGRLMAPAKTPKILAIMDRYVREVNLNETVASWHPKAAMAKHVADDGKKVQWRLWIGSRNLTRDLSWDVGLSLTGQVGGPGNAVKGVPELGHVFATHASLPKVSPASVRAELRQVCWIAPPGCAIHSLQLFSEDSPRGLPAEPSTIKKLIVVSPFLDGTVVEQLGKWGDSQTHRTLLSSRPELAKLASQTGKPLTGFQDLLFLDGPTSEDTTDEASDKVSAGSQDEEPEPRGLHAKIIYAEGGSQRFVWAGSANATQRGWNGPNTEIIASLEITRDVAAGLEEFVKSATTIRLEEIGEPIETNQIDKQLEEARKQVANAWSVTQQIDGNGHVLKNGNDPNPTDTEISMSVGLLGGVCVPWPREATSVQLPRAAAGEITELICCRLTLAESSVSWLQRAPLDPPPGDERDRQALARYLDPHNFLLWIKSLLTGDAAGEWSGDWDEDDKTGPQNKTASHAAPMWWAPTIEEVLNAWTREPASLVLIDKKVRYYLKLYQEQTDSEQTQEERRVIEEFYKTWNVLRKELVPGAK